ncbi:MAG TPA: PilZ domain-containing protein [Vicinamibacteria bacterium]
MNEDSTRAPRLPLNLQLRYRSVGAAHWHEGRVENISRSGVLFRAADLVDVDAQVEITLFIPVRLSASSIVCRARIVRTVRPGGFELHPGLAATISRYRFRRGKDGA